MAGMMCLRGVQRLTGRLSLSSPVVRSANVGPSLCRAVGTSGTQKSDNAASIAPKVETSVTATETQCQTKPKKYWVSYGFSDESEYLDRHMMHGLTFVSISICLTLGAYMFIYLPDFRMKDWAMREAYLELRRREGQGLPPIDCNLIDPAKVQLPTDEEIGDQEIII